MIEQIVILATAVTASSSGVPAMTGVDRSAPEFGVPYYTGQVYPMPKSAEYRDEFFSLGKTGLLPGKDILRDDARLAMLVERVERAGGVVEILNSEDDPCDTLVLLGDTGVHASLLDDKTVPDRSEGFLLHCVRHDGKNIVFLKGHDFHGLLWAIQSFNQLVRKDDETPVLRSATVIDYPDAPGGRCYTPFYDDDNATMAWLAVNLLRANVVQYRHLRMLYRQLPRDQWATADWRMPLQNEEIYQGWKKRIGSIGAFLNPLQVEWYDGIQPLSSVKVEDKVRSKSEEDIRLVAKAGMALAEAGGNLMILYDDFRFPINPDDVRDFGTAREADVYFLNRVYSAVAEKYPDFKILFCPPFYWGAGGRDDTVTYGESRDKYLAAIGKGLPKAIEIFWTGPRVKSNKLTAENMKWFTDMIQRKPVYWQNTCGTFHGSLYYAYPPEPMSAWKDWYYDGFFNDLAFYTYNGEDPYITMTVFDAMWNTGAYDPVLSGKEAARKLVGPDAFPQLLEAFKALEEMDEYGWFTPTALAARNVDKVREQTERLVALYDAAPDTLKSRWLKLGTFVNYRKRYLKSLLKNPDLKAMTEVDEKVRELAMKENAMTPDEKCVILTPNDFRAGRSPSYYAWKGSGRRYALWINGADSKAPAMEATFQLPYPLQGYSQLVICGLDHNAEPPCAIRILMNGNVVFEGKNPYKQDEWTTHGFEVKGAFLRDGVPNTIRIENMEDSNIMNGAPWFMINYVVLKQAEK